MTEKPFIMSVSIFVPHPADDPQKIRIVATGEFQPGDEKSPADSFILYSYRAYAAVTMIDYRLTDGDKVLLARTAVERGREYLTRGTAGYQLARLGGMSTSPKKAAAARANGAKSKGRPPKIK